MEDQVFYQGKWVSKKYFRVYVYNKEGKKLVNNYEDYVKALDSGLWFSTKEELTEKKVRSYTRKVRNDASSSTDSESVRSGLLPAD